MRFSKRQRTKQLMYAYARTPAGMAEELAYRLGLALRILSK